MLPIIPDGRLALSVRVVPDWSRSVLQIFNEDSQACPPENSSRPHPDWARG